MKLKHVGSKLLWVDDQTVEICWQCLGLHTCGQDIVGRGGALVETMTFNRRVVGSIPALATT